MSRRHLDNIRDLLCAVCGKPGCDPHHLQRAVPKGERGIGRKAADRYAIPLCRTDHITAEAGDNGFAGHDEHWLASQGVLGIELANALWAARASFQDMVRVNMRHLDDARLRRKRR